MGMIPAFGGSPHVSMTPRDFPIAPPAAASVREGAASSLGTIVSASGVLITDLQSGQLVYGRDLDRRRPIASLTKLMTALIVVETMDLDEMIKVPADIAEVEGLVVYLKPGERYSVRSLLTALLINSANDAAEVLARHGGNDSVAAFVNQMNERAKTLGLKDTSFRNPSGLDETHHFSTSRNIAWLTTYALRKPAIAERMGMKNATITSSIGNTIQLTNTNQLLHSESAVILGKTGTTDAAGECLLSIVQEGGRSYVVILLHSSDRYADMRMVLSMLRTLSV